MIYFDEASLNKNVESALKKKGIKNTTDSINELNGRSAIIDLKNYQSLEDAAFMKTLKATCKQVDSYSEKIIYIPVSKWSAKSTEGIIASKTPLGSICRYIHKNPSDFRSEYSGFAFIFYNQNKESFALYPSQYKPTEFKTFENLLSVLTSSHNTHYLTGIEDNKSPVKDVVKTTDEERKKDLEEKKKELVSAVLDSVDDPEDSDELFDDDEYIGKLLAEIDEEDDGKPVFNNARTSRMSKINDEFLTKKVGGETVKEVINRNISTNSTIQPEHLKVASINEEWDDVKFVNFNKSYDVNSDIVSMLYFLSERTYPVSILDLDINDTSTNMDYVYTYTVQMEDGFGKRFTITFDVPKLKNNRFMRLRGNEKVVSGQLLLLPCLKTDEDTVQCVSNYNKIFIRRKGLDGRSYPTSDRLIKSLRKSKDIPGIKVYFGDNSAICSKYELPVDYIDIAGNVMRVETKETIYYFDQDIYYTKFNADKNMGIPYAVSRVDGSIKYYQDNPSMITYVIAKELCEYSTKFEDIYMAQKPANRLNYSEASVMANKIPLAVVIGYSLGMDGLMKLCGIKNDYILDKRHSFDPDKEAVIRFSDGYIKYPINYATSMMLNGLSVCPTESYSLSDINKRSMWLDFLDEFGGRLLSDGLDNFADLFIDPITFEVCKKCKIPNAYFDMLMYANNLLADNKYNRHTDISGNRYRTSEIIAGYFYKCITKSYIDYKSQIRHGRKVGMTMKKSAVIDAIMMDPMCSDLSILNPLLEIEAGNSVSFKGLSGMNSDRSYSLDKRTYDDSMINKLALSTGFAANVGINRQTTIDMDIDTNRGYINKTNKDDMSVTKSFGMSEAVTPFGTSRDDPFRSAMTFIQTSKHSMRTAKSMPLLVTNGADEAMPYISSDTFAYKAKGDGKVISITNDYMIVEYDHPIGDQLVNESYNHECISLKDEVKKNSDGGFYITLKLDTDLKEGNKFKKGDIIAYDKTSYSNSVGESDNLAYNLGVLAKVAILNTDEGFEDSTSVSSWLSSAMATDVVVAKDISISKNANVYSMAKVGQSVQEGDPLIIFQNSFDEKDANILLKNITDPEFVSDLGRIRLKSKYTGVIQDIKIYRTCEIDDMSESLSKIVVDYEKEIKKQKAMYKKYGAPGMNTLDPDYKMEPTGIMKNNTDGVTIVFYIKYNDMLSVGDKCVAQSANKGVVKNIFPEGKEPFSEYRPNESIHALFAARSFNARMVTSVWISGAINKCMIELDRQVKEIMGIEWQNIDEMY